MNWNTILPILSILAPTLLVMWAIMRSIKEEIRSLKTEFKQDNHNLKKELRQEISEVKSSLKQEISEVKKEMHAMEGRLTKRIDSLEKRIDTVQETMFFLYTGQKIDRITPLEPEANQG